MNRILIFILLLFPLSITASRLPETIIKVGLMERAKTFHISCEGNYYIYELSNGNKSYITPNRDFLVTMQNNMIIIDGKSCDLPLRLVSESSENRIRINGRRYRDNISVLLKNGGFTIINELGLEDYLCGILPKEVDKGWEPEALKAQAVISRTYALRNLRKHANYDLCTQTHCQVYGGVESEQDSTSKAVMDTRAQVLVFNGELAQSLFHAACGGNTENPRYVWNWDSVPPSYLSGRRDKYCSVCPHNIWKGFLDKEVIRQKLLKNNINVGEIKGISMSEKTPSGRAKYIIIKHTKGAFKMPAARFRLFVDTWQIKSTLLIGIIRKQNGYEFRGRGWGHGVGLCQWGAKVMADKGFKYKEILHFYYPGTKVEKWEE